MEGRYRPYLTLALASVFLSGCTSPIGRVRHQTANDVRRRLDPNYKEPHYEKIDPNSLEIDIFTGRPIFKPLTLEKGLGLFAEKIVKDAFFPDQLPYQILQWGNDTADWIDDHTQFDFFGMKGRVIADRDKIGFSLSKEF